MKRWPPRPSLGTSFYKAHGLGNDYLVFSEGSDWSATPAAVEAVCDRTRGVGADGIVVLLANHDVDGIRLRMFNPDGSEFERSGNGLRVLASYLAREHLVGGEPFTVEIGGATVEMTVHGVSGATYDVSVNMGQCHVGPSAVGLDSNALDEQGRLADPDGVPLHIVPVSVGNPHLVTLVRDATEELLERLGPFLVRHPSLSHGANVQLATPTGPDQVRALIWERGVGRTSASGTSACAVAVAAVAEGLAEAGEVTVDMPGGSLVVSVTSEHGAVLRGLVEEVLSGELAPEWVSVLAALAKSDTDRSGE
jgi:diaminopimelate epimerase